MRQLSAAAARQRGRAANHEAGGKAEQGKNTEAGLDIKESGAGKTPPTSKTFATENGKVHRDRQDALIVFVQDPAAFLKYRGWKWGVRGRT